jgi:uncharacterized protein YvpB
VYSYTKNKIYYSVQKGVIMKQINIKYHTQINNEILPYVTCGTTCIAEALQYLNDKTGSNYVCDDDGVFQRLNSDAIKDIAKKLIIQGVLDPSAMQYRQDDPKTATNESQYTHLNNFKIMLVEVANNITQGKNTFRESYETIEEIKQNIDNGFPVILSGMFTPGGHYITIVGYDDANNFICDDPYGIWTENYATTTIGLGSKVRYDQTKILNAVSNRKGLAMDCITIS